MNARRPPRLAVWLLKRMGIAAGNAPLIGDLLEEFHRGRTSGWYWRQTATAILSTFGNGLRVGWLDIMPWVVGWCIETAVLLGLWLFEVPLGLRSAWVAGIAFGGVWLVMYLDYRVRVHRWRNESEMSDEESELFWERHIGTRFMALGGFGAYLLIDVIWRLIDVAIAAVGIMPGFWAHYVSCLVSCHIIWISGQVIRLAMRYANNRTGEQ